VRRGRCGLREAWWADCAGFGFLSYFHLLSLFNFYFKQDLNFKSKFEFKPHSNKNYAPA
jgi:hypothetical protein